MILYLNIFQLQVPHLNDFENLKNKKYYICIGDGRIE